MTETPAYTMAELVDEVEKIIRAISCNGPVKAERILAAMSFVQALLLDLDPSISGRSDMRHAAEIQGGTILAYLTLFREHYETTGRRVLEEVGGATELNATAVAGMTKQ